jgi:uncharacterized protein
MLQLEAHPRGVVLPVRAQAGARRNDVLGVREGMLRVAVTAAPEKGKANRAIVALLSEKLAVPKSSIELVAGDTSTKKRFLIVGGDAAELREKIAPWIDEPL